jgi:TRAP-type transport system periplasmic protein
MSPTVIAYNEVYNAIQNGVIAGRRERGRGRRADEVLRSRPQPEHDAARHHHPADRFSGKTFKKLPPDLQAAVLRPARKPASYGRQIESSEDSAKLEALEKAGKLKRIPSPTARR